MANVGIFVLFGGRLRGYWIPAVEDEGGVAVFGDGVGVGFFMVRRLETRARLLTSNT